MGNPRRQNTDDEIREAILNGDSWGDVFSALGYASRPGGSTMQKIRNRAADLDLTLDHLHAKRGPRRSWTDDDLARAVKEEHTWKAIVACLGTSHARVKQAAEDLCLDTSHITVSNMPPANSLETLKPEALRLRSAAEAIAVGWYALRGFDVFVPAPGMSTRADLVAMSMTSTVRVQVKTSTSRQGGSWVVKFLRGARSADGATTYSPDEIDEFFVVTGDGAMYRIPINVVPNGGIARLGVRYAAFRVEQFN